MAAQWQDQSGLTPMTPVSQLIGDIFVRRYYHTYHFSPGLMHRFYRETSKLGRPEANGAMASVTTSKEISDRIMSMEMVKAEIETVDAQESLSGGVIVLVTGHLITSHQDAVRREFTQTFFLAPQANAFYVLNDLFRFTGASAVPVAERPEGLADGTAVELEYMEALEEYFKKADFNNNGEITRFEAVSFLRGFCVPDHVLAQILVNVDSNKHGFLRRAEFFNALRLVSVAQSNRTLTPDIVKSVLHTLAATQIPPPKLKSPGSTSSLCVTSEPCSSSTRYPESDLTKASSKENNTGFIQALSLMLQDEVNLKKIAMEGSERSKEDKIKILRACEKILKSMNAVQSKFYQREQRHKKEIEEIQQMREDDKAYHLKIEFEVCKLELNRQKQELERNISDFKECNSRMKQHLDDMKKDIEELLNQKERSIDLCMSLSSQFSSSELEQATENFSESMKIGECGFIGHIYKGTLRRTTVAIKKLKSESLQGVSQFQQEVAMLTKVRHPNLVNLIGSCSEISALVYEFLPNGSLEDRLVCANNTPPLTWQVRTRIINDISLALMFLHSSNPRTIIHTDLKPGNILLDANYGSKLGGFGTSRIIEQSDADINAFYRNCRPADSIAYIDPHFFRTGESTPKCDVYSFGIIVLRLLTGKSPLNIASVVQEAFQGGNIRTIIDESAGKWPFRLARKLAKLGLRCAEMSRGKRPDMTEVCAKIEPLVKIASQSIALSSDEEEHVPSHFICPILKDIMKDPCVAADGFIYETKAIKRWLSAGHNTSPMTNLLLPHHDLIPNHTLCSAIHEWLDTRTVSSVRRS